MNFRPGEYVIVRGLHFWYIRNFRGHQGIVLANLYLDNPNMHPDQYSLSIAVPDRETGTEALGYFNSTTWYRINFSATIARDALIQTKALDKFSQHTIELLERTGIGQIMGHGLVKLCISDLDALALTLLLTRGNHGQ